MILSIDVGIKNLAMCLLDETTNHIDMWDVSGVPPESSDGLFLCLRNHLDAKPWVLTANTILIEKQPGKNKKMKSVENFLHAYFIIKCPDSTTVIYDARHKVPDVCGAGKTLYRQRKNTAITRCGEFLDKDDINAEWREHFRKSKKKDDLADTVLQALSHVPTKAPKKTPVRPRKPTENQKDTRYSKANLAWFYKQKSRDELEHDKRFMKDLKRYYSSIDQLAADIAS